MKMKIPLLILLFCFQFSTAQSDDQLVLKTILTHYYKNEKLVFKGRSQLLYFYCNRANNNEELIEAIQGNNLPKDFIAEIHKKITHDTADADWLSELDAIYKTDKSNLKQKITDCLSVEKYHEVSRRLNLNNQRLLIVSKPLYYPKGNIALVKVVFYRNIEHNNGAVLLMEKVSGNWTIKDYLNPWST